MYLVSLHGQADVLLAGLPAARRPSAAPGRTARRRPSPRGRSLPIRVMIFIEATTYGLSVSSTPNIGFGASTGPMQNGTTYIVRPRHAAGVQRRHRRLHLVRRHPVVRRAGVGRVDRADEGALLDPRHVTGVGPGQERAGPLDRVEADQRAGVDEFVGDPGPFRVRAVAPHDPVRGGQCGDLVDPGQESFVGGGGSGHGSSPSVGVDLRRALLILEDGNAGIDRWPGPRLGSQVSLSRSQRSVHRLILWITAQSSVLDARSRSILRRLAHFRASSTRPARTAVSIRPLGRLSQNGRNVLSLSLKGSSSHSRPRRQE